MIAVPDANSNFAGWQGACSGTGDCSLTMDADRDVTATFTTAAPPPPGTVRISAQMSGSGAGKVTSSSGIDCPGTCSVDVALGTRVSLQAKADASSTFEGWGGACGGGRACDFLATADATVWANFTTTVVTDDCAGLVPAPPGTPSASHTITFDNSAGSPFCMPAAVDGDGTLALDLWDGRPGYGRSIDFVSPTGTRLGGDVNGGQSVMTEQLDGFIALNYLGGGSWVSRFDSQGKETTRTAVFSEARGMAVDPTGGAVWPKIGLGPTGETVSLELFASDAHLTSRWHAVLPAKPLAALAVDRTGNTLVIVDGDDLYGKNTAGGIWVDHNGAVGTEFQLLTSLPTSAHLLTLVVAERVGSGLFVGTEAATWRVQIDSLSTAPAAPPAWLAPRSVSPIHVVHGGKGYAVLPNPAVGDCTQTIDVVSPSGKSCGFHSFRAASGSCATSWIRVGYDGTVAQNLPNAPSCSGRSCSCSWQWWSGFYR